MKAPRSWQDLELVEVVWCDAVLRLEDEGSLDDSESTRKFGGLDDCRDVGYLIRKTAKEIILAVSIAEDGSYRHSNTIPRGWVKSITHLTRADHQLRPGNSQPANSGGNAKFPPTTIGKK